MQAVQNHDVQVDAPSWEAAVSAWVDGAEEIRADELDSPYGRQVWDTYHLIGDTLRSQDLALKSSDLFYVRLSQAIDAEPTVLAPRKQNHFRPWKSGITLAVVLALAWLVLPYFGSGPESLETLPQKELASNADASLHDYFNAHQNLTSLVPAQLVSYRGGQP